MLLTVAEFKNAVHENLEGLVSNLQETTGRFGREEADAWRSSLPASARLLAPQELDPFHIYCAGSGHLSLEYQLPAASNWCDLILLGQKQGRPAALVMELKHWVTSNDTPGPTEGLMTRQGASALHPCRQVKGYTEYIRNFHSAVLDSDAIVNGCVFFTRSGDVHAYREAPNQVLSAQYPIFTTSIPDVERSFPAFAVQLMDQPAPAFAERFEKGRYRQDRGFMRQIGQQLLDPSSTPFVLIDNQDQAFLICRTRVRELVDRRDGTRQKRVVIVHGPPGSGKSVVAARVWASLVTDETVKDGNVVVTTTSASQNSNWVHLLEAATRSGAARGVVKKATSYHPASTHTVGRLRRQFGTNLFSDPVIWRKNVTDLRHMVAFQNGSEEDAYLVSLVDEAHALINPEHTNGRGQFGFAPTLGPQAWHIIRASQLTVFFLDREQGYRDRENTTVEDLRAWAQEFGATLDEIDLAGAQFRCAGSKDYTDWIEMLRSNTHPQFVRRQALRWRGAQPTSPVVSGAWQTTEPAPRPYHSRSRMTFEIVDDPIQLEDAVRAHVRNGHSVRLLSSYSREWKTSGTMAPHNLPDELQDFAIPVGDGGQKRIWAKPWNFIPENGGDYTLYVQAPPGSRMNIDPLCEVGCPYAVRGFDFDYVGLIWGRDLVWRTDRWVVQPSHVFETGVMNTVRQARREGDNGGPVHDALLKRVWQSYRILLTRAMRGVYVFVEDEETRRHLIAASGG